MATNRKKTAASGRVSMENELRTLGKRLDVLSVKARKAEAGVRAKTQQQLRALKAKQAAAQRALARLRRQSEAASAPLLDGLHKAWVDMSVSLNEAAKRFRETS